MKSTLLFEFFFPALLFAQPYPPPVMPDTMGTGVYLCHSLQLLASSTSRHPNTVRILVYGQSISAQDWWLEVKHELEKQYPHARLLMENRAIGGYSSQILYKTVEMDVVSFCPDLVLLHVYGNHHFYDTIVHTIRSRTIADVALQTDHYTGPNEWSDKMSYEYIPAIARKYSCALLDLRTPWRVYDSINQLDPRLLTTDGTHLNAQGNWLMAELIKPFLQRRPGGLSDVAAPVSSLLLKKDFGKCGDTLLVPFTGNRVDLIFAARRLSPADSLRIRIDDRLPSSFSGCWFQTRPYSRSGASWPWQLPGPVRVQRHNAWCEEEWYCRFLKADVPYDSFEFELGGSVTGFDGRGCSVNDFISNSGRVIIRAGDAADASEKGDGGDWNLKYTYKVTGAKIAAGDTIFWRNYSLSKNSVIPEKNRNHSMEYSVILAQGLPNSPHVLKIIRAGKNLPPIKGIRIYRPPLTPKEKK